MCVNWTNLLTIQITERRLHQFPTLVISAAVCVGTILFGLNLQSGLYGQNLAEVCVGVGFLYHVVMLTSIGW
jgi:uncharacterized PurR-regulated membrane protein YhhQ (DUF165 family)